MESREAAAVDVANRDIEHRHPEGRVEKSKLFKLNRKNMVKPKNKECVLIKYNGIDGGSGC